MYRSECRRSQEPLTERASGPLATLFGAIFRMRFSLYEGGWRRRGFHADAGTGCGIPQALEAKTWLATAQTGTGKTLAFLIPVIEQLLKEKRREFAALVLVPTRELAMPGSGAIQRVAGQATVPAALVVGDCPKARSSSDFAKVRGWCGDSGRLEDYLDRRLFHLTRCVFSSWMKRPYAGHGFLPAISESYRSCESSGRRCASPQRWKAIWRAS